MLSTDEIEGLLGLGHEVREFEVKGQGSRKDPQLQAKVVRACLAMGNLRDGGHVLIGVDDKDQAKMNPGLTELESASWMDYDELAAVLRKYSDPPLQFDVQQRKLSNGNSVAVIQVAEFASIPHLCAKELHVPNEKYPVLRLGALYVRTHGTPSSVEVASSVEMREVLDLAGAKQLRDFFAKANRADVAVTGRPIAAERYRLEREAGWS